MTENHVPAVMCFSGNDPSGGAGISADIQTISSQGGHCIPIITALTTQDSVDIYSIATVEANLITDQARTILQDMPISVFKIGLLSSVASIEAIAEILTAYPSIPVVLDPVLSSGLGTDVADDEMIDALKSLLLPQTTILTPNTLEAERLTINTENNHDRAMQLLQAGCEYVLITGTHDATKEVSNQLYYADRLLDSSNWERLNGSYHGSGCTLASAIAGLLAQRLDPMAACYEAQKYTWNTLKNGYPLGKGQLMPDRFFWATDDELEDEPEH